MFGGSDGLRDNQYAKESKVQLMTRIRCEDVNADASI
jgi:hypothetical protein